MKLNLSAAFARAMQHRHSEILMAQDHQLADAIEATPEGQTPVIPDAPSLYEQALTMLVTEVLCNIALAMRAAHGAHADAKMKPLVEKALRLATEARDEVDAKRRAGGS